MVGSNLRKLVTAVPESYAILLESRQERHASPLDFPPHPLQKAAASWESRAPLFKVRHGALQTEVLAFCRDLPSAAAPSWGEIEEPRRKKMERTKRGLAQQRKMRRTTTPALHTVCQRLSDLYRRRAFSLASCLRIWKSTASAKV